MGHQIDSSLLPSGGRVARWLVAVGLAFCPACERTQVSRSRRPDYVIQIVGTRADDPTWHALLAGVARFAHDSPSTEVQTKLPAAPTPVAQKALLDTLGHGDRVNAIGVLAIDARVLVQPITRLIGEGIPVFLIGDDARQTGRNAFIGADEGQIGAVMARTLDSICKDHRTIMVVHDNRGSLRSFVRFDGFRRELARHANLSLLRDFDCLGQPAKALQIVQETSERFPDLGGWALLGDWLGGLEPAGKPLVQGATKIVSYGAHPSNFHLLEEGRVHALAGADWEAIGYRVMQSCFQVLNHSAFPVVDEKLPPVVITRDNLEDYRKKWQHWMATPTTRGQVPSAAR
jgi:ribose transport system substrate-binding protein